MIETIVAVVGAVSTLAGVGIGVAGYRSQAALLRLQAAQLQRQTEDAERAQRLAEAAERRAQAAERRAVEAGQQRVAQEENADRARERRLLLAHARHFTVEAERNAVRVGYRGRFPVTDVRVYWRGTDITPGGLGLGLSVPSDLAPYDPRAGILVAPVPGLPDGTRPAFADIHVDFTDVHDRRWRRRGNGALLLRGGNGEWDPAPTSWLEDDPAQPWDPRSVGHQPQGWPQRQLPPLPWPAAVPGLPEPGTAPITGLPDGRPRPTYGDTPLSSDRLLRAQPKTKASRPAERQGQWYTAQPVAPEHPRPPMLPVLAVLGIGLGVICLLFLAF
ncbi:hypothetical protein AMK16_32505 [Streptomyces sp. CB00455]|uniref:hypothetical protein n=1 Tax=Streptomyces sp. CB00455 TaxID=1703927 RepID=UPI00093D7144|nr:hypothetical protein [Streptomyces sp. CB00455]OKK11888.1 hypothetical protein AMK16_32505 [Streptomyces sp. CB00455]